MKLTRRSLFINLAGISTLAAMPDFKYSVVRKPESTLKTAEFNALKGNVTGPAEIWNRGVRIGCGLYHGNPRRGTVKWCPASDVLLDDCFVKFGDTTITLSNVMRLGMGETLTVAWHYEEANT